MRPIIGALALIALAASGQVAAKKDRNAVPAATNAGEAVSCIPINQIRNTRVHGDKVIDFHMNGNRVYRNVLPYACNSLGFQEQFSYETSLSQLCSTDTITVLHSPPMVKGATCGLGQFQPITITKR